METNKEETKKNRKRRSRKDREFVDTISQRSLDQADMVWGRLLDHLLDGPVTAKTLQQWHRNRNEEQKPPRPSRTMETEVKHV